jgi:HSP20 family protein
MHEKEKMQHLLVKMYRTADRLMVATPMPGLQPEDILVQITENGHLVIQGEVRSMLKDIKELLIDEWSAGAYERDLILPEAVDGERANLNYGNGILVVTLPTSEHVKAATLTLNKTGADRGERAGHSGHAHV